MPNGGTDICGSCWFNRKNKREFGDTYVDESEPDYCDIRDLAIAPPASTCCFNHPVWTPECDILPVGPIFTQVPTGRVIWKNSPDTEAIRRHLLTLVADIPPHPTKRQNRKRYLYKIIVWQLGEFQERRALDALEQIQHFAHQDGQLRVFAAEALRKITHPSAKALWYQRYTPSQMVIVEKMLWFLRSRFSCRFWENIWENDEEYHWKFQPDETLCEMYGEKGFDSIAFINTLKEEFHIPSFLDFETHHPAYTLAEAADYLLTHYSEEYQDNRDGEHDVRDRESRKT